MHELSVAQSLVELAESQLDEVASVRVSQIVLRIGALAGIVPQALRSAMGPASVGTRLAGAALEIEEIPVAIWCNACDAERELPAAGRLLCSACGARAARVIRGSELELVRLEIIHDAAQNP